MSEKIRGEHLQRGAYVYVRQSTPYQVRNHLEGKERQYALAERAEQRGFSKVIVIDEDLGRSGSGSQERVGFGRLLASVCQGMALHPVEISLTWASHFTGGIAYDPTELLNVRLKMDDESDTVWVPRSGMGDILPSRPTTLFSGSNGVGLVYSRRGFPPSPTSSRICT